MNCDYNKFVEDYNDFNLTTHDVRRLHNLNSKQYTRIRNLALENGDINKTRHMNYNHAKFYYKKADGTFEVAKNFNNNKTVYGRFNDEETAKLVVAECIKHDWELNEVKDFIDLNRIQPKNYALSNGYYLIQKSVNGVNKVFCILNAKEVDEDLVKDIVLEFRRCNWNINCKDDILSKFNIN